MNGSNFEYCYHNDISGVSTDDWIARYNKCDTVCQKIMFHYFLKQKANKSIVFR